jgi:hypothetical protein
MSDEEAKLSAVTGPGPQQVQFHYIKSHQFRVVHVDGAVAGVGPSALFVSFYSEHLPIPQLQVFQMTPGQKIGEEVIGERVQRPGVEREVEVGLMMNIDVAKAVRDVLGRQIEILEKALQGVEADKKK